MYICNTRFLAGHPTLIAEYIYFSGEVNLCIPQDLTRSDNILHDLTRSHKISQDLTSSDKDSKIFKDPTRYTESHKIFKELRTDLLFIEFFTLNISETSVNIFKAISISHRQSCS